MADIQLKWQSETRIELVGELNRHSIQSGQPLDMQLTTKQTTLYLDLSGVSRVDTAGLAWLIEVFAQFRARGTHLVLENLPEQLQKLMALGQVTTLFERG